MFEEDDQIVCHTSLTIKALYKAEPCGGSNLLFGDVTFEDVSEKSGIANRRGPREPVFVKENWRPAGSYRMGAAAADFDNDGWPDIYWFDLAMSCVTTGVNEVNSSAKSIYRSN
jgi:hypothetical protein